MADHANYGGGGNNDVFIYMGGDQEVPDDVTHVRVHKSVKIIRTRAFMGCRNLVSMEMHDGVEIIEEDAFHDCRSLRGIKLPGVRVIGKFAFFCCKALEDVEFGIKLEVIGRSAFNNCTSLRSIKVRKGRVIGQYAFYGCDQLTDVELSKDLERIEGVAFGWCRRLRRIAMPLKDNLLGINVFNYCGDLSQVDLIGGIHQTISSLLVESWKYEMNDLVDSINQQLPIPNTPTAEKTTVIRQWMERVIQRIDHYKSEHYALLKEAMSLLELALWKANLDDNMGYDAAAQEGVTVARGQRKRARKDRCITSGASVVIKNVLPFLKLE
jgi:hypothetical protein